MKYGLSFSPEQREKTINPYLGKSTYPTPLPSSLPVPPRGRGEKGVEVFVKVSVQGYGSRERLRFNRNIAETFPCPTPYHRRNGAPGYQLKELQESYCGRGVIGETDKSGMGRSKNKDSRGS